MASYREKKKAAIKGAIKAQNVKVVNKVELAEKSMPKMSPTLQLSSEDLPEIKNWSVGKSYTLQIEVEQTSMSQGSEFEYEIGEDSDDKGKVRATFKVKEVKAV